MARMVDKLSGKMGQKIGINISDRIIIIIQHPAFVAAEPASPTLFTREHKSPSSTHTQLWCSLGSPILIGFDVHCQHHQILKRRES